MARAFSPWLSTARGVLGVVSHQKITAPSGSVTTLTETDPDHPGIIANIDSRAEAAMTAARPNQRIVDNLRSAFGA